MPSRSGLYKGPQKSRCRRSRLDGEPRTPGIEPSFERYGIKAQATKLLRRTDARSLVRSGAVGDDKPVSRLLVCPLKNTVRQYPDAAGNPLAVVLVAGASAHVQNNWRF